MRDAGNHAFQNSAIAGVVQRTESQRIHHRQRPRAHRENVAENAADARCSALKGLNETRVIVRLDLERDGVVAADIDDARVLARPLQHQLAARRQLLQVQARALVGTVLAPHDAENAKFGIGGLAPQQRNDLVVFG